MSGKDGEPLRGEAAWKAEKQRIAANNEAAYARGRKEREADFTAAVKRRRAAAAQEASRPPEQPGGTR